jgi:serine/threonine protein kinase
MTTTDPVRVFVSYAHADQAVQRVFDDQLRAAEQQGAFAFWDDTRLEPGAEWHSVIQHEIARADIALLLVSTSFLSSSYCTTVEVHRLLDQKRKIFWVIVNECPWELSPFKDLQACATLRGMDDVQIKSAAKRVVLQIAAHAKDVERMRSPAEMFLAQCAPAQARLFSNFEELSGGWHCWIQRAQALFEGSTEPETVVIKVLLNNPFEDLAASFAAATERAAALRHPCFIRLRAHYLDGRFPVLVMEAIDQATLQTVLARNGPFRPDEVRDLIAAAAEALAELHERDGVYGLLTSHNVFIDARTGGLRFSALSITGLLSQIRGWKEFIGGDPGAAAYLIPEQFANQPLSPYSDQYVLGQIAIEMLSGHQPAPAQIETPADLARKREFFDNPLGALEPWIHYHQDFAATLSQLLHVEPQNRFRTMDDAVIRLRGVDDEVVGYARYAYTAACEKPGFFETFYSAFFTACPGAREEFMRAHGGQDPKRMEGQAVALKIALGAALDRPETLKKRLAQFAPKHRGVPPEYFPAFTEAFVATLTAHLPGLPPYVIESWRTVLQRAAEHIAHPADQGGSRSGIAV